MFAHDGKGIEHVGGFSAVSLGNGGSLGPHYAEEIAVQPGAPDTIAVARRNLGFSPRHTGVAIFDAGIQRTTTTPGHTGSNAIVFGVQP